MRRAQQIIGDPRCCADRVPAGFGQVQDGVMKMSPAQFSALFEGLDWRLVRPERVRRPELAG
ncbi:MAG: hypothetical protein CMI50_16485 [Paracoccus sp.]|nr:hypothetical protein [Paracoccus sp. (in: a-proteobacteria)]